MAAHIFSLQEKQKYLSYSHEILYTQQVAQERIHAAFVKWAEPSWLYTSFGELERNTRNAGVWDFIISSLLSLLVYTHDLRIYNSGKSHSLHTVWRSDTTDARGR